MPRGAGVTVAIRPAGIDTGRGKAFEALSSSTTSLPKDHIFLSVDGRPSRAALGKTHAWRKRRSRWAASHRPARDAPSETSLADRFGLDGAKQACAAVLGVISLETELDDLGAPRRHASDRRKIFMAISIANLRPRVRNVQTFGLYLFRAKRSAAPLIFFPRWLEAERQISLILCAGLDNRRSAIRSPSSPDFPWALSFFEPFHGISSQVRWRYDVGIFIRGKPGRW